MRIYTRTGDGGETALLGGGRVSKAHPRVQAYGGVDELNAFLGAAIQHVGTGTTAERLALLQHDLFALGAILAAPPPTGVRRRPQLPPLPAQRIAEMESWIDEAADELPPLRHFVLPGGSPGAAALHVARTVCRRAERGVVALAEHEPIPDDVVVYLNRLSDLLFALARQENARAGIPDVRWEGGHRSPDGEP